MELMLHIAITNWQAQELEITEWEDHGYIWKLGFRCGESIAKKDGIRFP